MKRKRGRPKSPEPLEVFNLRITARAKHRLKALAELSGKPSNAVIEAAFWQHLSALPRPTREAVERIASTVEAARAGAEPKDE